MYVYVRKLIKYWFSYVFSNTLSVSPPPSSPLPYNLHLSTGASIPIILTSSFTQPVFSLETTIVNFIPLCRMISSTKSGALS